MGLSLQSRWLIFLCSPKKSHTLSIGAGALASRIVGGVELVAKAILHFVLRDAITLGKIQSLLGQAIQMEGLKMQSKKPRELRKV